MKTPEEIAAWIKSMPVKTKENPFWQFDREQGVITSDRNPGQAFDPGGSDKLLRDVRQYFRQVYACFRSEAQVLCVEVADALKLKPLCLPTLSTYEPTLCLDGIPVEVFVLPQVNSPVNSIISDAFWQEHIVGNGITPVARIHSHHTLDAYQSATDYNTLNSNTMEIVIGHITREPLHIAYWLDEHWKDTKQFVFQATQESGAQFSIVQIPSGSCASTEKVLDCNM